jgi:hypothetical protein
MGARHHMTNPIHKNANRSTVRTVEDRFIRWIPVLLQAATMVVGRRRTSSDELLALFRDHLAAMKASDDAYRTWLRLVDAEKDLYKRVKAASAVLHSYAKVRFGEDSLEFINLGFRGKKRRKPSVQTRKKAVEKRAETRKARKTMGRKQRKAIRAK